MQILESKVEKAEKAEKPGKIPESWPTDIPEDNLRERERIKKFNEAYEKGLYNPTK